MIKILVPIDGSDASVTAAEKAVALAKIDHSEVTFLSVVEAKRDIPYEAYSSGIDDTKQYLILRENLMVHEMTAVKKMLDCVVEKLDCTGIKVHKKVVTGDAHGEIIQTATEGKFNLIVMGHTGLNPLKRLFIGSVAKKVIEDTPCSVLIVK